MKKFILTSGFFLIAIFFTITSYAEDAVNKNLSFAITGDSAKLVKVNSTQYQLTMTGVSPYIQYLGKSPNRSTGLAQMNNFIAAWSVGGADSFAAQNPNGVFYAGQTNNQENTDNKAYPVQISNPSYDEQRQQFSCILTALAGQEFIFSNIIYQQVVLVIN